MTGHLSLANGVRIGLRDGFVLGRVAGCDLVIDDSKASRRHAKFHVESGVVEIEDLQSSNGTLLNEKPVTRRVLREGDRVQIGKTVLVFHEGEVPGGAVSAPARPAPPAAPAAAAPTVMATPPAAPPSRPAPAASFDDNDLFGDSEATSVGAAPPPPPPAPTPPPPARPAAAAAPQPPAPRQQPPAPAAPPPPPVAPRPGVVEFADEVVEVKKPAAPAAAAKPAAAASGPAVSQSGARVLQFSKQAAGKGLLGDDMGQMSGGMRALIVLGVLALGAAVVWLVKGLV